jgi:hypothetical protein
MTFPIRVPETWSALHLVCSDCRNPGFRALDLVEPSHGSRAGRAGRRGQFGFRRFHSVARFSAPLLRCQWLRNSPFARTRPELVREL